MLNKVLSNIVLKIKKIKANYCDHKQLLSDGYVIKVIDDGKKVIDDGKKVIDDGKIAAKYLYNSDGIVKTITIKYGKTDPNAMG